MAAREDTRTNLAHSARLVLEEDVLVDGEPKRAVIAQTVVKVRDISEVTEGEKVDPASGTPLADTGQLAAGKYEIRALLGANTQTVLDLEHRNATNTGNVILHRVYVGPNSGMYVFTMELALNERVRVVMGAALTGHATASLQTREV
jgi:hypothetical protein